MSFRVVFPDWYDHRAEHEAEAKGWLQGVEVHLAGGVVHPLFFYDPVRLAQDLEEEAKQGNPFIARPGLIVIPEITRHAILSAVAKLAETDYFATNDSTNSSTTNHGATLPDSGGLAVAPEARVRVP